MLVVDRMRAMERERCSEGPPSYAWLSRRGGARVLTREQQGRLERLTGALDFDGCHTALQSLRTTLNTNLSRLCYSASQVPEIAEGVILQVISDRQRANMLSTATETRRHSSALIRRFSMRRVGPTSYGTLGHMNTVCQPAQRREAMRKSVSFSSRSPMELLTTSATGDRQLILKPMLKTIE